MLLTFKKTLICFFLFFILYNPVSCVEDVCRVESGFSPGESAIRVILNSIKQSKSSIKIAAYSFTSKEISSAIVEACSRGVRVEIVADKKSNSGKRTALNYLAKKGVHIKLNDRYSIMHNKFMIFDDKFLETGSFNYSKSAVSSNAENVILIKGCSVVDSYRLEFERLWNQSEKLFIR